MGQGQPEATKGGKKDNNKVILKVDMDCEACKQRVRKVLKKFPGIENMDFDMEAQMVTLKGNVDAYKVYEALRRKCGKRTMLVYPLFSKEDEKRAKEDAVISSVNKIVEQMTDLFQPKPPDTTVELKVPLHCGACVKKIKKVLLRVDGVMEVEEDQSRDKVVVKGRALNADEVSEMVRESGKHCEVISVKKEVKTQEKKKGDKKEEKKVEDKAEKEEESEGRKEKKEEAQQGKKNGGGKKGGNNGEKDEKKAESKAEDEEKEEGKSEGKKKGKQEAKLEGTGEVDVKKYAYMPYQSRPEYVYPPQLFSDENPNACTLM